MSSIETLINQTAKAVVQFKKELSLYQSHENEYSQLNHESLQRNTRNFNKQIEIQEFEIIPNDSDQVAVAMRNAKNSLACYNQTKMTLIKIEEQLNQIDETLSAIETEKKRLAATISKSLNDRSQNFLSNIDQLEKEINLSNLELKQFQTAVLEKDELCNKLRQQKENVLKVKEELVSCFLKNKEEVQKNLLFLKECQKKINSFCEDLESQIK